MGLAKENLILNQYLSLCVGEGIWCFFSQGCNQSLRLNYSYKNMKAILYTLVLLVGFNFSAQEKIKERFNPPAGYKRDDVSGWANYLRDLPLKPDGSPVLLYNGQTKVKKVHAAVIDLDVGKKNLQQCADAVIRLRAEYLYAQGKYDEIAFNFTNCWNCAYAKWRQGYRVKISGNKTWWEKRNIPLTSYKSFREYLNVVFMYAGTLSLSRELKPVDIKKLQIGDVFVQGGSPGHAVIVVDVVLNVNNGKKRFLLAQSYMPAQDIHVLYDFTTKSPWFEVGDVIQTPEWTFYAQDLKRF